MKYCFYLTFQISYDDDTIIFAEVRLIGSREEIASSDIEEARKKTMKKYALLGKKIEGIVLIHSFQCIYDEE